jgi:hypothetical protein
LRFFPEWVKLNAIVAETMPKGVHAKAETAKTR